MEMVVNGVSTRKVAAMTEELCGREFTTSTVSDLCKNLDPLVEAWNGRDLGGTRYPFVVVDALVIKVREGGRVRARSALIATGVNEAGFREILGLQLGDSESERSWSDFFTWLKGRGLHGVDLVVSDHLRPPRRPGHCGMRSVSRRNVAALPDAPLGQYLSATIADATPKALHQEVHARVRAIFEAPDVETARLLLARVVADYAKTAPAAVATLERGFDDATAVLALPAAYRTRLRTTNGQERLNEEIRRRERVIRIFPNRESAMRLLGALLMEQDEVWSTGKRYLDMTAYWQWRAAGRHDAQEGGPTLTA